SEITGTPPNSCGPGCGGKFITRAHKGFWSEESGYYYTASGEPGFRKTLLHIWDRRDPKTPKFVGRANPQPVGSIATKPPNPGPHTLTPTVYDELPNSRGDALPRTYGFMTEEA